MSSAFRKFRADLALDLKASSGDESAGIKLSYLFHAGFQALLFYRLARMFFASNALILAKAMTALGRFVTSCDLHYRAEIAGGVNLPHGRGVVIGEGVKIEKRCSIFQHASLGSLEGKEGYPRLEEGVNVYPGTVVAGSVKVGEYSRVGPNVYLTVSVPKHTRVTPSKPHIQRVHYE